MERPYNTNYLCTEVLPHISQTQLQSQSANVFIPYSFLSLSCGKYRYIYRQIKANLLIIFINL